MAYWLFKSEPATFGIDHLAACDKMIDSWDGVRNYQARNFMRDQMKTGDRGFFYHSNCAEPGIVGMVKIVKEASPDLTALDQGDCHYDPKATMENPRWVMVDVQLVKKFKRTITLKELRDHPGLTSMTILQKGNRLSITPVTQTEWDIISALV